MADNITVDNADLSDFTVATDYDSVNQVHVQILKFGAQTNGSSALVPGDVIDGPYMQLGNVSVASTATHRALKVTIPDATTGEALSFAAPAVLSADVTTTAVTYAANKVIGGVLSFASAAAVSGGSGHALQARFFDYDDLTHDGTNGQYRLDLYSATPSGTYVGNNQTYAVASDAEAGTYLGSIFTSDGTWVDVGPAKVCAVQSPGPWPYKCAVTTLFGVLVAVTDDSGASSAGVGRKVALHAVKD